MESGKKQFVLVVGFFVEIGWKVKTIFKKNREIHFFSTKKANNLTEFTNVLLPRN